MANYCQICGKKLRLLDGKIAVSDGILCTSCWVSAGMDMGFKSMLNASKKTLKQIQDLIEIEILKKEAEKARINDATSHASELGAAKPIDIFISVDAKNEVDFHCEGQPIINFEDLINGKEMIIGDGFILNDSNDILPEARIVCEFDPAIVDPGHIYYEEGTFKAGEKGRFEIDDPPVNLEEYAKITNLQKGKIQFSLFFGEQKIHTCSCEMLINPAPKKQMEHLMEAITYNEEKNAPGPVNVFLYARNGGCYEMDLMRNPELLYSMYSNGKEQLIGDVYVSNDTSKLIKNVKFEAKFSSDILEPISILLGHVPAGEKVCFEVDDPPIHVEKLERLTDIEVCTAWYKLYVNGKVVAEATGKITICPYDQWNAALILLPAYMTPNHPNIVNMLQNASKWMLINGMNPSLEGYQSDAKRVEEMIGAVYNAVSEANIIYSNPPASFFGPQRIRLCETVFEQKFATCMDMTILFASCLESFGLHPVLITAPGHIFAGVWLTKDAHLKEPIISDAKMILKYIKEGKLVAVECTTMNAGKDIGYEESKEIANKVIRAIVENNIADHECIDVQIAREIGVRPLPMRIQKQVYTNISENASETLTAALGKREESQLTAQNVKEEKDTTHNYNKEAYTFFEKDLSYISIENFYDKETKRVLKDAIVDIVEVEGPISQPALIRTMINRTSLGRASKQITEHLDKMVAAADVKITRQNGVRFLWKYGTDPSAYRTIRLREQRSVEDVCKYELKNAICYLIQENGPMSKEELTKAMVSLLGYNRMSKKIEEGTEIAIKAAKELKAVKMNAEGCFELS